MTPTATPTATPVRSGSAAPTRSPVRTSAPAPTPSTSVSPPPPPDVTAPTVGDVTVNPGELRPKDCPYGYQTSTVTVTVTDDRSGPAALAVTFRYTLEGVTSTVRMSSVGRDVFQATLGPLPTPKQGSRIPIQATAVDAAGNPGTSASPVYVTLYDCPPIIR